MGKAFNLTAQIHLQGPSNVKSVVSKIRRELGTVKTKISLEVPQGAAKNLASINSSLNTLSRTAIKTNSNLLSLKTTLDSLGKGFNNLSVSSASSAAGVQNVSKSVTGVKKSVQEATKGIEDFGKQSGLAFKRLAALSAVTTVVYGVVNAVHSAAQEFVVFNKEMVRLSQVTGKSVGELKGISDEITRLSTSFGVASKDLLTVATTLAQAGLSATETKVALEALAKSALAPSFDSLAQTTEGVIASMRQFGLQGKEVEEALGSINAVSAAFAVEAGDIITAIQRTGGVFANSSKGVSQGTEALNEFIAVFTSIRATTRESAETIATGLRTIFTRVQRGDTIKALRGLGIELTDLEGKFVGPYEATNRLSEGLRSLDPRDLRFGKIVEELGGFRQIGKVIPLIQQYAIKEQALGIAQKGQTSISRDAITAQASLAIQFNKTRESFVALIREIGDSASFQAFATVSLSLTNGFINLASSLKPLLPLLLAFTAIKAGSVIKQYSSGFGKGLMGGGDKGQDGGGGGIIASLLGGGGGGSSGATARETQNQALSLNTSAINSLSLPMNLLGQNIILLNKSLIDNTLALRTPGAAPKLNSGGIIRKFARGGVVPGSGDGDTVPAMLEPGEFVIRKKAVETLGTGNLHQMNKSGGGSVGGYANGGRIQKFADGGPIKNYSSGSRLLTNVQQEKSQLEKAGGAEFKAYSNDQSEVNRFNPNDTFNFKVNPIPVNVAKLRERGKDTVRKDYFNTTKAKDRGYAFEKVVQEYHGVKLSSGDSARLDGVDNRKTPAEIKSYSRDVTQKEIGTKIIASAIEGEGKGRTSSAAGGILGNILTSATLQGGRTPDKINLGNVNLYLDATEDHHKFIKGKTAPKGSYQSDDLYGKSLKRAAARTRKKKAASGGKIQRLKDAGMVYPVGAIRYYQNGSKEVNEELAGTVPTSTDSQNVWTREDIERRNSPSHKANVQKIIKDLDSSPKTIPPENVFTGIGETRLGVIKQQTGNTLQSQKDVDRAAGSSFTLPGFLSSSKSQQKGMRFSKRGILNIKTKQEPTGIDVNAALPEKMHIQPRDQRIQDIQRAEQEVILPRSSSLKILQASASYNSANMRMAVPWADPSYNIETEPFYSMDVQQLGIGGVAKAKMAEAKIPLRDMYRRLVNEGRLDGTGIKDKDFVSRVPNKHDDLMNRLVIESFAAEEAIAQKAIEGSELFGLVGLIGGTKHRSLGPEMINGKSIYTKIGVLSEKTSTSLQKQMEGVNASSTKNLAESMQAQQFLGSGKNLAIDFDETLVSGADIFDDKGQPDIAAYSDLAAVSKALQNAQLKSPIGTHLKDILAQDPSFIKNIRVLSARPQSSANLIASTLTRLGIPISADRVTGVSTPGMTGQDVAQAKANNLGYDEALIDDNLQNILAARKANKTAHHLTPVAELSEEELAITGKAEMEGYTVQQILTRLGAPAATRGAMSMDFPKGLGPVAQFFGIEDNIPTDVKRTIDSSSIGKYREEVLSYLIARDGVFGEKNPKGSKGLEGLIQQVKNKGQRPGSTAQRTVGYIDSDVLAAPENAAVVGAEMAKLDMNKVSDYKMYLSKLAATARNEGSLERLSAIGGVAGSGKSSLMLGGKNRLKADNASLRQTTRSPILTAKDISSVSQIIDVTATVSPDRLSGYLTSADRVYSLESSTKEQMEEIKRRKTSRDINADPSFEDTLYGRTPGSTAGAPSDSGPMQAMLASEIDPKKLRTMGVHSTGFKLKDEKGRRRQGPTVETKRLGVTKGGFAPTTLGHKSIEDAAQAMGISAENFAVLVGSNEAITSEDPDAHDFRTVNFDQDFRYILAKAAFDKSIVNKADPGFGMPDVFEGKSIEDGRRHFIRPDYSSSLYMAGPEKTDKQLQKYKDKGYSIGEMKKRTTVEGGDEEISATAARAAILSGDIPAMKKFLPPAVFDIIQKNLVQLQNRDKVLPEIMKGVKSRKDLSLAGIDAELANFPARLDRKRMEKDPAYKIIGDQVDALRERKKKILSHASFEPFTLMRQLAKEFPEKYGLSLEGNSQKAQKFAFGGAASDTVPALLTPGEFVINKKAAENIGYGKLNRMNHADKVQGFARGGSVGGIQRFKEGREAWPADMYAKRPKVEETSAPSSSDSSTNSIMNMTNKILVISNVIQPMLTKFAQGLAKGNIAMEQFTKTVSETVEQASSFALSGSLAIGSVGGTQSQQNRAALLGGVGGAVSGGISAFTTVGLEKALLDNSSKLSAFDKLVEEGKNATSEQDRVKISKEINESFSKLNLTIKENIKNIDQLDIFKSLGESVATLTQTMIGAATVQLLLTSLEKQRAAVKVAEAVGAVAGKFPGGLMGVKAAQTAAAVAGTAAPAAGMGLAVVLGKVAVGFGRIIPYVGVIVGVLSLAYEGFKFFNKSMAISSEELLKFNERLLLATKSDPKNNINNANFTENVLSEAMKILNNTQLTRSEQNQQLGAIETGKNPFNLTFLKQLSETLASRGLPESMFETNDTKKLIEMEKVAQSIEPEFNKIQALKSLIASGMDKSIAETQIKRMQDPEIKTLGEKQTGKDLAAFYVEQNMLLMNRKVQKSTLELVDIMNRLNDSIKYIGITSQESVKNLNNVADILSGTFQIQSNSAEKDVSKLSNLPALRPDELTGVVNRSLDLLNITDKTKMPTNNETPVNEQMMDLVRGTTEIRKSFPQILRLASVNGGAGLNSGAPDEIRTGLEALLKPLGLDNSTREGIIKETTSAVQAGAGGGPQLTIDELIKKVGALDMVFETSAKVTGVLQSAQEEYAKTIDSLNAVTNRMIGISSKINEANSKNILKKSQEAIEMKEIFGSPVSLEERNKAFDDSIKELTKNKNNPAGMSDAGSIGEAIRQTQNELLAVNNGVRTPDTANQQTALGTTINSLNSALEQMGNSGVKASNALNKIADIQKTMASRMSLFERIMSGDIEALLEMGNSTREFDRVMNATTEKDMRGINPAEAFKGFAIMMEAATEDGKVTIRDKFFKKFELLGDDAVKALTFIMPKDNPQLKSASEDLMKAHADEKAARDEINKMLQRELSYLKENTILQTFQMRMKTITEQIVQIMTNTADRMSKRDKEPPTQAPTVSAADRDNGIKIANELARAKFNAEQLSNNNALGFNPRMTGKVLNAKVVSEIPKEFKPITDPNQAASEIKEVLQIAGEIEDNNAQLAKWGVQWFLGTTQMLAERRDELRLAVKNLELYELEKRPPTAPTNQQQINNQQQTQPRQTILPGNRNDVTTPQIPSPIPSQRPMSPPSIPTPPPQSNMSPPSRPGTSFNSRSSGSGDDGAGVSAVLKGATADLKMVVSSLASVFPTLNDPINNFKSSVDNLLKGLSDFNAKGGIKGPNIPEKVAVTVKFDEELAIDTRSINNKDLLNQIGIVTRDAIAAQFKELKTFG